MNAARCGTGALRKAIAFFGGFLQLCFALVLAISKRASADSTFRESFLARCLTCPIRVVAIPSVFDRCSVKMCCGQDAGKDNNRKGKAPAPGACADPAFQEIRGQAD